MRAGCTQELPHVGPLYTALKQRIYLVPYIAMGREPVSSTSREDPVDRMV